jgi:glutathione S-transferase
VSARSFRPLWALEEIGVPYELKMLPFPPRVFARGFKDVNPLGTIPAFEEDALFMTESSAICQYLAARYSPGALDVAPHEADFGRYLNFLHFGEATLTFPQTLVLRYAHREPPERLQPQIVDDYARWFHARLRTLAPLLAAQPYLCAGRFTAADISVGYALMLAELLDLSDGFARAIAE